MYSYVSYTIISKEREDENTAGWLHFLPLPHSLKTKKIQMHPSNLTHFRRQEESRVTVLDRNCY